MRPVRCGEVVEGEQLVAIRAPGRRPPRCSCRRRARARRASRPSRSRAAPAAPSPGRTSGSSSGRCRSCASSNAGCGLRIDRTISHVESSPAPSDDPAAASTGCPVRRSLSSARSARAGPPSRPVDASGGGREPGHVDGADPVADQRFDGRADIPRRGRELRGRELRAREPASVPEVPNGPRRAGRATRHQPGRRRGPRPPWPTTGCRFAGSRRRRPPGRLSPFLPTGCPSLAHRRAVGPEHPDPTASGIR